MGTGLAPACPAAQNGQLVLDYGFYLTPLARVCGFTGRPSEPVNVSFDNPVEHAKAPPVRTG
jgi:hypothetical protein